MARKPQISSEIVLYFCILILALGLRTAGLGSPLSEVEAQAALPAHALAQGGSVDLGSQPAYVLLSSLLFFIFGSTELLARLVPALFGAALVVLPYFWRDLLGKKAALVLALALALDPGMVAVSRLASGQMIAVGGALIALTAWRQERPVIAGIFAVVSLLAAPIIYLGLVAALLVWLVFRNQFSIGESQMLRPALVAAAATLLIGGTLFFRVPAGVSAIGTVAADFWTGITEPSGMLIGDLALALVGYALPALIFGSIAAIRAWTGGSQSPALIGKVISLYAFFSLLFVFLAPGRQVADLLWPLLALWVLAAMEIGRTLQVPDPDRGVALAETGLMLLLGVFFVVTMARLSGNEIGDQAALVPPSLLVGGSLLILGAVATILIGLGWSARGAAHGLVWALAILFSLSLLSASTRFARVETTDANDLWAPGPAAGQLPIVLTSLNDLSFWDQGQLNALPVDVQVESAALSWALRDFQEADPTSGSPPLAFTLASSEAPAEFAAYRGQSFALSTQRGWQGWPPNFLAWLLYREAPVITQEAIFWARQDLFIDGDLSVQPELSPQGNTSP